MKKLDIINMAFDELGLSGYIYDLEPEQLELANKKIGAMVASWSLGSAHTQWPITTPYTDETDIANNIIEAVYLNAAIRLAPSLGKVAMPDTKIAAKKALEAIIGNKKPYSLDDDGNYPNSIVGLTL